MHFFNPWGIFGSGGGICPLGWQGEVLFGVVMIFSCLAGCRGSAPSTFLDSFLSVVLQVAEVVVFAIDCLGVAQVAKVVVFSFGYLDVALHW